MKYAHIFLSTLIFSSTCLPAYDIRPLNQKKIDQHAISIEKKVTRDYYLRMALVGIVAARVAYGVTTWVHVNFFKKSENLIPENLMPVEESKDATQIPIEKPKESIELPKITWSEWVDKKKVAWVTWGKYVVSKENVTNKAIDLGKIACAYGFQTGMGFVMEGVYGKLNYPNTLRWYICSHVPYTATLKVVREMLASDQSDYNTLLLQEACNRLVLDGEKICGYMTYKTKQLDIEEQQIAERTTRHFFTYYNEFLQRLSDQLACNVVDYNTIDTMLTSFEADVKRQLKLFFYLEGETDEERAMIGERVKRSLIIEHIATLF